MPKLKPFITGVIAVAAAFSQTPVPSEFDVASVKPNKLDDHIVTVDVGPGGSFTARGYTLALLIQRAYGVMDWNISDGPRWIRSDRWDVSARVAIGGNLTEKQLQPMLQALLADRFKLRLRRGSKEISGYALSLARGGPKVTASAEGAEHPDTFRMNATGLSGQGITMVDFARFVAGKLGLVAVDKTGLQGLYDLKAEWTVQNPPNTVEVPGVDPREELRSAVFAALQNQLGLRMSPQRITIDALVLDGVEKASGN